MTVEECLQQGYDTFKAALGSVAVDSNVESGWKNLFRNKVTWNLDYVNASVAYLEGLCTWMGQYALSYPRFGNSITLREVNASFESVQAYAYHQNGDAPTRLC